MNKNMKLTATLLVALVFALLGVKPVSAQISVGALVPLPTYGESNPVPINSPQMVSFEEYLWKGVKFGASNTSIDGAVVVLGYAPMMVRSTDAVLDSAATRDRNGQLTGEACGQATNPQTGRDESIVRIGNAFPHEIATMGLAPGVYTWTKSLAWKSGIDRKEVRTGPIVWWRRDKAGMQRATIGRALYVVSQGDWRIETADDAANALHAYQVWRADRGVAAAYPLTLPPLEWARKRGFLSLPQATAPANPEAETPVAPVVAATDPQVLARLGRLEGLATRQESINQAQVNFNGQTAASLGGLRTNQDAVVSGLQDVQVGLTELQRAVTVAKPASSTCRTWKLDEVCEITALESMNHTFANGKTKLMQVKQLKAKMPLKVCISFKYDTASKSYQLRTGDTLKVIWQDGLAVQVEVIEGS